MVARIYNKLNTAQNSVCTPLHTVLEQCSKYFRTVNGADSRDTWDARGTCACLRGKNMTKITSEC